MTNKIFATFSKFNIRFFLTAAFAFFIFSGLSALPVSASQTDIAGPTGSGTFGSTVTVLPNGNIVVTDPGYDLSGPTVTDVGAVYLYNGATLALISTLTGSTAFDNVGGVNLGVTVLTNGNYVVRSQNWDNPSPTITNLGAVTWCSATTGCSGTVSASNSLVGGTPSDQVGSGGVTALTNGNYVVSSLLWDNPSLGVNNNAGAVTWGNGAGGTVGLVTASNSLIGGRASDNVGSSGVTALTGGNYVVGSPSWDDPSGSVIQNVGAVTWGNGTTGTVGLVTTSNSLVGGRVSDNVGSGGVTALTNGNYVVSSPNWDIPSPSVISNVGAVTWGSGTTGTVGLVSASNSLVGGGLNDNVGSFGVTALTNGNYVVRSPVWDNPSLVTDDNNAGAATWGNGAGGTAGLVSASNSLIGGSAFDQVGRHGVTALTNGNYVVSSVLWDNPSSPLTGDVGAATWGSGAGGTVGLVSASNSLVGGTASDNVGGSTGVTALTNGNYVVSSRFWDNPSPSPVEDAGAATWGNGAGGTAGLVSASNSLVGGTASDQVGNPGVTALTNGNYVVSSGLWDNPSPSVITNVGAVTWGNGTTGTVGTVTASNSLTGGTADDFVGSPGVTALTNGNYVVGSKSWDNPSPTVITSVGAATWGSGAGGTVGLVSASNSLVGGTAGDQVGDGGVTAVSNGNYVVRSPGWNNPSPALADASAFTFGNGASGTSGLITSTNSVVGTVASGTNTFAFDATRNRVFVGRNASNIVSILFFNTNATSDGTFSTSGIWDNGVPNTYINGVIPNGRTVTLDSVATVGLLSVGCTGAIAGASSTAYIIGNVNKDFCGAVNETFLYPLGDNDDYSPMTASNVNGTGSLLASVTDAALPGLNTAESASRFWRLSGAGITTDLSFTYVDADINGTETNYKIYKRSGGVSTQVTPFSVDAGTNTITATGISSFSDWGIGNLTPTAANGTVSGSVLDDNGVPVAGVVINLSGTQDRKTITNAKGDYYFDNVETTGFYTVTPSRANYNFSPFNRSFSLLGNHTAVAFGAAFNGDSANPLDTPEFFVRQQYVDILGREPDEGGFNYWSNEILQCGNDAACTNSRRRDIAAAFFIEQEFQQTGSYIYNLYKGSLGRRPGYSEYSADRKLVIGGPDLETEKTAFANSFVHRADFVQKYQSQTTAESFVDALLATIWQSANLDLGTQRGVLLALYQTGSDMNQSRALVLRQVGENPSLKGVEYNPAFVLTEYFAYLRRNPEPEGYDFWLDVLNNREPGNFRGMVCSFITSTEYQKRFGAVVTHSNAECGR